MVSKPDLVTFLEQMKNPWDVRRLETPAIYTGRGQWMEPTSPQQEQGLVRNSSLSCGLGRSASVEMILEKSGFLSVAVIGGYHLPRSVSLNHSWIHLQWLLFSITVRTETLLLAGDNLHESITIPFRGGQGAPRKTEHFWKTLKTLLWKFLPLDDSVWAELRTYCQSSRNIGDRVCGLFFFFLTYNF